MKLKERVEVEINNFILNWTSDEKERKQMAEQLQIYMEYDYEDDGEEVLELEK